MYSNIMEGRRLVVVDVENLAGGVIDGPQAAEWTREALTRAIGSRPGDTVVVGTCHRGLLSVGDGWPRVRYVVRSGQDGADLELVDVLAENVADRFASVVVASGDHIFTESVVSLEGDGVPVTVVGRRGRTSHRLAFAASHVIYIDGSFYEDLSAHGWEAA